MRTAAVTVVAGLVIASATASADPASLTPPGMTPVLEPLPVAPQPQLVQSYQLQTLAVDGIAAATLLATAASANSRTAGSLGELALATYLLGAPVIHAIHGRPGRALGSAALRVGLPLITAELLVAAKGCSCDDDGDIGLILLGGLGGALAASIIDTAFLAKGDDPPRRWAPMVAPTAQGGMTLGVGGAF